MQNTNTWILPPPPPQLSIFLRDIELDSPQAENKDDYEYIPSSSPM